jgi:hypothetical protein
MAGKVIKLIVPISKNNPVNTVPKTVKMLNETSSYCHIRKIILTICEIVRNQITKESNKEYLLFKFIVKANLLTLL